METSASSRTSLYAGIAAAVAALLAAVAPRPATAEILLQTSSGVWVSGTQFAAGFKAMPSIVVAPEVRNSSGFLLQRSMAWGSYRRADSSTGVLLVDPAASGSLTASSPRQASVRSHVSRAHAYRLEYFNK